MWKAVLVAAAVVLVACENDTTSLKTEIPTSASRFATADSIYNVAVRSIPIDASGHISIGVLDEERTPTFAKVSYENSHEWVIYAFRRNTEGWTREDVITRGVFAAEPAHGDNAPAGSMVYDGMIAQIGNPVIDEWYVSNLRLAGIHHASESYAGAFEPTFARFFPGTQSLNDTTYTVSFVKWQAFRQGMCDPFFWESSSNPYSAGLCHPPGGGQLTNTKPNAWELTYQLTTNAPVALTIVTWEANNSEYLMFGASPYHGSSAPVASSTWEWSPDGTTGWTTLPAYACGKPQYSGAYRYDAFVPPATGSNVYLRVRLTLNSGQVGISGVQGPYVLDLSDIYHDPC